MSFGDSCGGTVRVSYFDQLFRVAAAELVREHLLPPAAKVFSCPYLNLACLLLLLLPVFFQFRRRAGPGDALEYIYDLPPDHYPGIFYYHPHFGTAIWRSSGPFVCFRGVIPLRRHISHAPAKMYNSNHGHPSLKTSST